MEIKPKVRGNICYNSNPEGCAKETRKQIDFARQRKLERSIKTVAEGGKGPKAVLVIGCSTGYGLASRITAAFEYGASTIGVSYEKLPTDLKTATPGYYNNNTFDQEAKAAGLFARTFNADAFAHETRQMVIEAAKSAGLKFDLVIYSLASSVRTDPDTKQVYQSTVKTQKTYYSGWGINILQDCLVDGESEVATEEDIFNTVKVMGGEDWQLWIEQLTAGGVLAEGCTTLAYSYIGPVQSYAIYRDGTIGAAKRHLEQTAKALNTQLKNTLNGSAYISVNKGVVTRSSAVIPVISLYLSVLFKIMKEKGIHEGCMEQMDRLFAERLYTGPDNSKAQIPTDDANRIRLDELELRPDVQEEATRLMAEIDENNFHELSDVAGYIKDFYAVNGFEPPARGSEFIQNHLVP